MDILTVPVPILNKDMAVEAYLLNCQKGNHYLSASSAVYLDGGNPSPALEVINSVGIEAFTLEQPVFIPVSSMMLLADLGAQCVHPPGRVIFLFDNDLRPEEPFISHLRMLKIQGFRIAFRNIDQLARFAPLLHLGEFIFLDTQKLSEQDLAAALHTINTNLRNLSIIAANVKTREMFEKLQKRGISMYEGEFYRIPVTHGATEVDPLKVNLLRLLNIVHDQNFEFNGITDIVQRDTALSISLMRLVNSPYIGVQQRIRTIGHAVALLGQNEVRKWVTTSVTRLLGADKPSEITRLSLIRAKFCENLSPVFHMREDAQSVFLMGLFSLLDVILDLTMEQAFEKVFVSEEIQDALVSQSGRYYPLFHFMERYEAADWMSVSQQLILHDIQADRIYSAYIDAISWYSDLILEEIYSPEMM